MSQNRTFVLIFVGCLMACSDDNPATPIDSRPAIVADAPPVTDVDVDQDITADTTWTADTVYHLKRKATGLAYIFVHPGATLTIEAGTRVLGGAGSALVVARGGKIMAEGTDTNPVVFSHDAAVGSRAPGQWGGVVILGNAPNNLGNDLIFEGFAATSTDPLTKFAGNDPNDNSGVLRYVRIEFGGVPFEGQAREFNSLTLCGVGRGTTIDFVQTHFGADDGIELFGGTVDLKHVVISQNDDDGLDTDNGWTGKAQFVIVQHTRSPGSGDPNGYESDNCGGTPDCSDVGLNRTPRTAPTVYNATLVGSKNFTANDHGAVFRRDTTGVYRNHIFLGFKSSAILVPDPKTCAHVEVTTDNLSVQNTLFFNNTSSPTTDPNWLASDANCDEKVKIGDLATNKALDPMLTDPLNATAPNFKPMAGSPALDPANAAAVPTGDSFWETVNFVGAIGATDWTTGWTDYPAN